MTGRPVGAARAPAGGRPDAGSTPARPFAFAAEVGPHDLPAETGLNGYYYRCDDGLVTVPVVIAAEPGTGACSRWLDSLPTDIRIEFRCVMNSVLAGALARRGFRREAISVPELGEVDRNAWVRP